MSVAYAAERGLLAEDEIGPIERSHFPLLAEIPRAELLDLARWLRDRRDRARDMMSARRRAARGKGGARPPASEPANAHGMAAKKQVFARALKRVNARLDLLLGEEKRARNAARLRAALARVQATAPAHPGGEASGREGMRAAPAKRPRPTINPGRIGSTSQQGRNAQARRDAR